MTLDFHQTKEVVVALVTQSVWLRFAALCTPILCARPRPFLLFWAVYFYFRVAFRFSGGGGGGGGNWAGFDTLGLLLVLPRKMTDDGL